MSALAPITATATASSHIRTRPQWPMLTTSESAPMVQKFAFAPTKPNTNAIVKPPAATSVAMPCGVTPSRFHAFR